MENEFLTELQKLLEKYDADISWTCSECSDTHGIYEEKMLIFSKNKLIASIDGGYISSKNLVEN